MKMFFYCMINFIFVIVSYNTTKFKIRINLNIIN
jgi:hypothetical protein